MQDRTKTIRKRCVSFCTALSYDLTALANAVKRKEYLVKLSRDVLYIKNLNKACYLFSLYIILNLRYNFI